jgi:hypothetical protein
MHVVEFEVVQQTGRVSRVGFVADDAPRSPGKEERRQPLEGTDIEHHLVVQLEVREQLLLGSSVILDQPVGDPGEPALSLMTLMGPRRIV